MLTLRMILGVDMKRFYSISLLLIVFSCSQKIETSSQVEFSDEYEKVIMVMPSCEFDDEFQTKNEASISAAGIEYLWSVTDTVGVFPDKGSQIYFSMSSNAGEKTASFDGGGWALKKGFNYFSYFPFNPDFYIEKDKIPISFGNQIQNGNGSTSRADLGRSCHMVANGETDPETGYLKFTYKRLGVLFMNIMPVQAGKYTSLTVRTENNDLIASGTYNAIEIDQKVNDPVYTDAISLTLKETNLNEDGNLVTFMMMPPFNMSGGKVIFELMAEDGTLLISSVPGKDYTIGKAYQNKPNVLVSPAIVELSGDSGTFKLNIRVSNASSTYSVTADSDWLTFDSFPSSGSATVSVTAAKNTGGKREGHITVSETVNGVPLENIVTVTQYADGMNVDLADWKSSGKDYGGTAQ